MVFSGLLASACFGMQLLVCKYMIKEDKQDPFAIGFGFLLFCGLLGLVSLSFEAFTKPLDNIPWENVVGPMMVGLFTAIGIVCANIAAGLGIAGISNSIINS